MMLRVSPVARRAFAARRTFCSCSLVSFLIGLHWRNEVVIFVPIQRAVERVISIVVQMLFTFAACQTLWFILSHVLVLYQEHGWQARPCPFEICGRRLRNTQARHHFA